uniref:P-type domain-containing protein n=1 Tax=Gopherus agassizii TaxID=38772 RepID=A0A452I0J4_9SAUR
VSRAFKYAGFGECAMNVKEQMNCGYAGISVKECKNVPWCFSPHLKTGNIPLSMKCL